MTGLTFPTINELRNAALVGGSPERFLGRLTLAAIGVLVVTVALEMMIPGDEVDAVWLGTAAALIVFARQVGFWPSVLVAFGAAGVMAVLVIPPTGGLPVGTIEDLAALVLFVVVVVLGASAVTPPGRAAIGSQIEIASSTTLVEPLTAREREILALLMVGMSNRQIARHLVVSGNTVKTHLEHLYRKLGVSSRLEATARAHELELIRRQR